MKVAIDADAVRCELVASTQEELIYKLANPLIKKGVVAADFPEHVLDREKKYPTGLPFDGFGAAIPHTDPEFVRKPAIAVATLKQPIQFHVLGSPDESVDVSLVFMLALDDGHAHIEFLQKVIKLAQCKDKVETLFSAPNDAKLFELVNKYLSEDVA